MKALDVFIVVRNNFTVVMNADISRTSCMKYPLLDFAAATLNTENDNHRYSYY